MSETTNSNLNDVEKTLLITLYIRAMESQRPDALLKPMRNFHFRLGEKRKV